jgi:hypothetical protein
MLVSVETILVPRVHDLLTLAAAQSGNLDLSRLELLGKRCRWRVGRRRGSGGRGTAKDDMVDVVRGVLGSVDGVLVVAIVGKWRLVYCGGISGRGCILGQVIIATRHDLLVERRVRVLKVEKRPEGLGAGDARMQKVEVVNLALLPSLEDEVMVVDRVPCCGKPGNQALPKDTNVHVKLERGSVRITAVLEVGHGLGVKKKAQGRGAAMRRRQKKPTMHIMGWLGVGLEGSALALGVSHAVIDLKVQIHGYIR